MFELTKSLPGEKRLPKITTEETCVSVSFLFHGGERVFWLCEWKIIEFVLKGTADQSFCHAVRPSGSFPGF